MIKSERAPELPLSISTVFILVATSLRVTDETFGLLFLIFGVSVALKSLSEGNCPASEIDEYLFLRGLCFFFPLTPILRYDERFPRPTRIGSSWEGFRLSQARYAEDLKFFST